VALRGSAMADIFISYSKSDHALALKLSAFLESEGWTVWWDKSLAAADLYRDEIMKQLAAARAVITIWTENSVKSDWVRAEAGRAKAEGKLIPVKTPELTYGDIPLPFGEMHTENISSTELIRAAIVGQLAKPAVTPSTFWQITNTFKFQILTWIGIVGSAITLFANLKGVLDLADWARELVAHWHDWTQMFWGWLFSWTGIKVPREFVPLISFIASVAILVTGVNLSLRAAETTVKLRHVKPVTRKVRILGGGVLVSLGALVVLRIGGLVTGYSLETGNFTVYLISMLVAWTAWLGVPMGYLIYFAEERLWVVVNSLLYLCMSFFLLLLPLFTLDNPDTSAMVDFTAFLGTMLMLQVCWIAVIVFSPQQQLARRLGFVVLGVLTLIALSEISKRDLHQYLKPAKVSEISSPTIAYAG
jgi:hypothetical protein